jgi:hypothetical protein
LTRRVRLTPYGNSQDCHYVPTQDRGQEIMNSAMNDLKKHVELRKIGELYKHYFLQFQYEIRQTLLYV